MTITNITSSTNLGTTAEIKTGAPTLTALQTGTTTVLLNAKVTTGSNVLNSSDEITVYYAISPYTYTADATLPFNLMNTFGMLRVKLRNAGNSIRAEVTGPIANNGGNLYTWFDSPALAPVGDTAATLTITSVELP